ncbi:MAG: hydrogenase formation protein HypD [Candidatus Zixiibacteriota bacterium]|nr:MAG: hydrogenase formation protein HypD [candidate division Zixibacteria bacterium]
MKYLDEFRDPIIAKKIIDEIHKVTNREWTIMEICGGQTHSIMKNGIDQLIPDKIQLVHGPGCPVCVTPLELIDKALLIASRTDVIFTSFGDMLRVPGSKKDLFMVKSEGADVRIVYSPLDSLKIARENPDKKVVFFGVGFETTAPSTAMLVYQARREGLKNVYLLTSHVLVPPAMTALLSSPNNKVQAYLAAGHVCAVMGYKEYSSIAEKYKVPIVVTGFEPIDILGGILAAVKQLENGKSFVENKYPRVVTENGNTQAQSIIEQVFEISDRKWRGIGTIPLSGLKLKNEYREFDAELFFETGELHVEEPKECISGIILQGLKKPSECPAFGKTCTPQNPLGATMVSSEGACAAYYSYQRHKVK